MSLLESPRVHNVPVGTPKEAGGWDGNPGHIDQVLVYF